MGSNLFEDIKKNISEKKKMMTKRNSTIGKKYN